jgi:nicotinamidase-related amidase
MPATNSNNTALILVDVLNSFFKPGAPNYYDWVCDVVPALTELLVTARRSDALVVHAVERHRPGLVDFEHPKLPTHCEIGADDAEYLAGFEPVVRDRETEVGKRRYSAFFGTDLDLLLREQGIRTVVVAGVKTNVCIRATIQDAFANGYAVLLPRQATSSNRRHLEEAALEDVNRYFGRVCSLAEAVAVLS